MCEPSETLENFTFNPNQQFRAALNSGECGLILNIPNVRSITFTIRFGWDMCMLIELGRLVTSWWQEGKREKEWELPCAAELAGVYPDMPCYQQARSVMSVSVVNSERARVWCRAILGRTRTDRSRNFHLVKLIISQCIYNFCENNSKTTWTIIRTTTSCRQTNDHTRLSLIL